MKKTALAATALALLLSGCSAVSPSSNNEDISVQDFLAAQGLEGKTTKEIIEYLDTMPVAERPTDLLASVRTDELQLSNNDEKVTLDLPEGENYVAIAPYLDETHDCYYHSLTTCLGEMGNEPMHVVIKNDANGQVLVDEDVTTYDNGFVGFWLPEDVTGKIEVTHQGHSGTADFSTVADDDATCISSLQLS
ncbi:MAG: CueP family metal-binding protein [Corynebacterium sp.]|nr:CueP family metal-binding protein [Corynebacterium sp.]